MRGLRSATVALLLLASGPALAAPNQLSPSQIAPRELTWRGEERWRLVLNDETGQLRLGFVQTPSGDYLLSGSLQLDDAELGVTGTGRWREGRLIVDLVITGGVRGAVPDAGKRQLYPDGEVPATIDSTGFAMLHAELNSTTLSGSTVQYQTNIVTENRLQGPLLRLGQLEHEARAQ